MQQKLKDICRYELGAGGVGGNTTNRDLSMLGDLAPFLYIYKTFGQSEAMGKRIFYDRYKITEKEMARLFHSIKQISL